MATPSRISDLLLAERPRERLVERGPDALSNAELIAILLRTGIRGASAVAVASNLLQRFGSLEAIARAPLDDLRTRGIGRDKAAALKAAFALARRLAEELRRESPVLDHPDAVVALLRDDAIAAQVERLQVVLVNTRRRLIRVETVAEGLLDQLLVHAREVFRPAISANAHAVILAHNHPSGDPTPSEADIRVTREIIRAGQLLKIELLDHIILGRRSETRPRDFCSLRELGYFAW
ncbi:MAG: DNA repair protein RadC [Verrucomicrobia bacterium]|nr:MAG: DNA repair protein RadC [Verrucomicrobiota bacterium]